MSILDKMGDTKAECQSPDSSPASSDSESQSSEAENILPSINEPDVSLDEMLSLACRQGKLDIVQLLLQSGAHINHRNKAGNTPLLEACSQGHVLVANYLLENGSKIDAPTETTLDSALTWACTLGNTNIVDALLQKHADVEHRTKDGCTALMFACLAGHRDVAEKLLDANSEINVESESNKDSPLTFACWKGHYDVVELLLLRKAHIEHRTKEGFSPLMFAALGGHSKVARKLLQSDAQVNVPSGSNNDIPLTSACWKGHHNVVKLLLEYNSNIEHRTKDGCTPLMLAAREGHIYVADLLLKNNAQVNVPSGSENNIPLTLACWKGHSGVVRLLLDHNSNIEHRNKAGCTPLMLAAREGHFETTSLLLERNAQVNVPSGSNDDTPLTLACWKGHKNVVMLLLDSKSNIDHQTKTGCTPLMEATREGHKDVAETLLNHKADVELPDNYGQSPLFMACWKGHRDVAELLLQRSAYRDCRTKTGITPLFQACRENHISIVELLLEYGAGVNTPFPNSRENPMTLCAEKGHQELVELLLEKGASHDCHTKKGCSPIFLACKEGHLDIAKILLQQNANVETPDCRGNTPIMAAFKNGHVTVVDWLIKIVRHLPSDELCHKILMSSVDDKDKEVVVQQRSKCLATIQEMKKKRELLALRNAQNLVQELDDERDREEKKKKKKAAKRRDKNKRKKNKDGEKVDGCGKLNGVIVSNHVDEYDELDEEETKDHIVPTENRVRVGDEKPVTSIEVLKISEMPTMPDNRSDVFRNQNVKRKKNHKKTSSTEFNSEDIIQCVLSNENSSVPSNERPYDVSTKHFNGDQHLNIDVSNGNNATSGSSSPVEVIQLLNQRLNINNSVPNINRQLPKTSGVCTQGSSTSGPSRVAVSSQTEKISNGDFISVNSSQKHWQKPFLPVVSSVAITTCAQVTTTYSDPRMEIRNIAPPEVRQNHWEEDTDAPATSNSSTSRNSSFDEYRESDWKELSRTSKMVFFELTVPNSYCGRVIGKGGKKINLITDDSGAQITIDKPPANIVPANRVITIKGTPPNAEKARMLVTKALNTPSLSSQEIVVTSATAIQSTIAISKTTSLLTNAQNNADARVDGTASSPAATSELSIKKRTNKPLPSTEVQVTPLIPYSKVAKASSTLEQLQKEAHSKARPRVSPPNNTEEEKLSKDLSPPNKAHHDGSQEKDNEASSPPQVELNHPFQENSYDSTFFFYDSYNPRKISEPGQQSRSLFGDTRKNLAKEIWPMSSSTSNNLSASGDDCALGPDRSRSISWTGRPKGDSLAYENNSSCRSMSSDQLDQRNSQPLPGTSAWTNTSSNPRTNIDDVDDEQVFTEEVPWRSSGKSSVDPSLLSGTNNDGCDVSSSPTSSVSSSKVELTTYFDNDSGMGGSNALDSTPTSLQSESQIGFQDQPYLDTAVESQTWYQQRGAYSAPSSPALPRNGENLSRGSSPRPGVIRSHPSMDEINTNHRQWAKKNSAVQEQRWSGPGFRSTTYSQNDSPENHDSGLSSPRSNSERRTKGERQTKTIETELMQSPANHMSKQWTVERFQDVRNLTDLLKQLSLEKYTPKLEQNGVSLESIVNLTERDLQLYEVPKGPRLKILKACEVMRNHRHAPTKVVPPSSMLPQQQQPPPSLQQQSQHTPQQPQQLQSQQRFFSPPPPATPQTSLNPTRISDHQSQLSGFSDKAPILLTHHQQQQQQHQVFSSQYRFPDFLPYAAPAPPPQLQQQGYNIILPNNQQFLQQPNPHQQTVMAARCDDFSLSHNMGAPPAPSNVEQMHQNQSLMTQQFMYPPDNQPFYYFHPQS